MTTLRSRLGLSLGLLFLINCAVVYAADEQIKCFSCNSKVDSRCRQSPLNLIDCSTECYSKIFKNGDFERGCASSLTKDVQSKCSLESWKDCVLCKNDACNTVELRTADIGIWQSLPLKCYTCVGEECTSNEWNLTKCTNLEKPEDCWTVFSENDEIVSRGCRDIILDQFQDYCEANEDKCFNCKSNGCNIANSISEYKPCWSCDSSKDSNCIVDHSKTEKTLCNKGCMVAMYPWNMDINPSYHTVRSCLEDKDIDDQNICLNGGDKTCVACTIDSCNTNALPEKRLHCLSCNGDCDEAETKMCTTYKENDQCYYHFDALNDIDYLGCASTFTEELIDNMIKDKNLLLCEGVNCNNFENIPSANDCIGCISSNNSFCATNPMAVASKSRCKSLPYTQCYTKILENGSTERGCLGDLDTDSFWDCLSVNSTNCTICAGNRCNEAVFPPDRLKCHQCNSNDDKNCENNPNASSVCEVYDGENESCVTILSDGVTYRGCSTSLKCKINDLSSCNTCSGSNCNVVNLKRKADQVFGTWQQLPINCYTCEGQECLTSNGTLRKCENNNFQDCMTVFNENQEVVRRGCSDLVELDYESFCDRNPTYCKNCKSSACNSERNFDEYTECIYCDSRKNPNCLLDPESVKSSRQCAGGCMSAWYPISDSSNSARALVRSCLDDKDQSDRDICQSGEDKFCQSCENGKCNNEKWDIVELECNHCNGADCEVLTSRKCSTFQENDACFVRFDTQKSAVEMGCKSALTEQEIEENFRLLWFCDENNCNTFENLPLETICFTCSSHTDENCAIEPTNKVGLVRCSARPYTDCYTRLNELGHTERGCVSTLEDNEFEECLKGNGSTCEICSHGSCNENIFPADRQQCFRCNSNDSLKCEENPVNSIICPIYNPEESCVIKLIDNVTYRDCSSQLNCNDSNPCVKCKGNNCNTVNLAEESIEVPGAWQLPPINCYTCEAEDCSNDLTVLRKCEISGIDVCMTVFNETTSSVVSRGCSKVVLQHHEAYCDSNPEHCFKCLSNGCNIANSIDEYIDCWKCDSTKNRNCALHPENLIVSRKCRNSCMVAMHQRRTESTLFDLIRTCADDKDIDDQDICNGGHCLTCNTSFCNDYDVIENRLTCNICADGNCESLESIICPTYSTDDQCYILFDDSSSIIKAGCRSEFDDDRVLELVKAKQLYLCDGNDCNNYNELPKSTKCVICNSKTDPSCVLVDNRPKSDCTKLPFTQCYYLLTNDGFMERGCLSSLENDDFIQCWNNATNCHICDQDDCNTKFYPENQIQCHQCNSIDNPEGCHMNPTVSDYCPQFTDPQECVTKVENGVTYRGCSGQYPCQLNTKNCVRCEGENCNRHNLKRKDLFEPGSWQSLPLNCFTCVGEDCANSKGVLKKCENNDQQHCVTVFKDGVVTNRGCSDTIEETESEYCDTNPENCFNCQSSGCNVANATTEYQECLYCDSSNNVGCLRPDGHTNTRLCLGSCMTAMYPRNNDDSPSYNLVRTCLDDKDIDDQFECLESRDNKCVSCDNEKCNTDVMPETRLKCLTCEGVNCADPISQECSAYNENDQCFMFFDDTNSVTRMGCKSVYNQSEIITNIKKLFLCSGDDCNTYANLPEGIYCTTCNTQSDANCAVNPTSVTQSIRCSELPHTRCYTQVDSEGHLSRGCVSSLLQSQFIDCISGNSSACKTCSESNCNVELFPSDRRSCHKCNSDTDPNCESNPNTASLCTLYQSDEICVTSLVNGTTQRGCGHELTCDTIDRTNCRTCGNDNCNTIDLEDANIGLPGKWQALPINCYNCTGKDCADGLEKLTKCSINDLQNCMTIFDENGVVVARGCSDFINSLYNDHCDQYPNNCPGCKSSGCNVAESLDDYVACIACDSIDNSDCFHSPENIKKTRLCHQKCMVALSARDSDPNPAYDLVRSCWDDKDIDDREECDKNLGHCQSCDSVGCNTFILPETPLSCNVCEDDSCEELVPKICSTYRSNDQCYILFDSSNSAKQAGCLSEFSTQEIETNFKDLLLCDIDNCNSYDAIKEPKHCMVCDSKTNELCATRPQDIANIEKCTRLSRSECYVQITEDGHTQRGCASNLEYQSHNSCVEDSTACLICSNDKCNGNVFPEARQSCHRCQSGSDANCNSNPNIVSACPVYSETDSCVVAISNDETIRACGSELTCDTNDRKSCRVCNEDNCNTLNLIANNIGSPGLWTDLPLNCFKCSGDECSNLSSNVYSKCENNNLQNCMTVFDTNGAVIRRGCSDEVETEYLESYCEEHPELCFSCKSDICNIATSLDEYIDCIFCDSNVNPLCTLNAKSINRNRKCYKSCMVALYPRTSSENSSYELVRSCADDKEMDDQELCGQDADQYCKLCNEANCNTVVLPDESRLSCYQCTDENCEDPEKNECSSFNVNDKCFVLFDKTNNVAQMGCVSSLSSDEVSILIKAKLLRTCSGDNCNGFENLPQTQSCTKCNSTTNPDCAVMPVAILTSENCATMPYTECYSQITEDGVTIRDCIANLDEDLFEDCINGNNALCETCTGQKCNDEVFPKIRSRCHICDSATNNNCQVTPQSLSICPLYNEDDACVVTVKNDITYRGCKSELTCDVNDSKNCRICSEDGCNTVNLLQDADGVPGLWQDLPLSCYHCDTTNCDDEILTVCENNNLQTCKTVFNSEGVVKARGCSDDIDPIYGSECETSPNNCYNCKSNNCNNATSVNSYIDCYFCDSALNLNCVQNPERIGRTRKCQNGCMAALYPATAGENPSYELIRTCADDKNLPEREQCRNSEDRNCRACHEDRCNDFQLPVNRESCYHCNGENCESPTSETCATYRDNEQCFILFDDVFTVTRMGCKSIFTEEDMDDLIASKKLFLCDRSDCNTYENLPQAHSCQLCSSRTNAACANSPNTTAATRCSKLPHTSCYSRTLDDKSTERGCLSSLEGDDFLECYKNENGSNCTRCEGDACNNIIYPVNRLACHQCNSQALANCSSANPGSLLVCSKYDKNDVCVSELRGDVTYRGCGTDFTCDSSSETCDICDTAGCNTIEFEGTTNPGDDDDNYGKWQDLPLTCYDCDGDECEVFGTKVACENNNEQDCVTVFNATGSVVRRGCEDTVYNSDYGVWCSAHPDKCYKCKSNKCNNALFESEFIDCLYCDSYKDSNCVLNPNATTIKTRKCQGSCMASLYLSQVDHPIYELIRTCANDKDELDASECKSGSDGYCRACEGKNCNNYDVPANRTSCYKCSGDDCDEPIAERCLLHQNNDQCYYLMDDFNSIVGMGCRSDIPTETIDELLKQKKIYLCSGADCNSYNNFPVPQTCYICQSSSETICATEPESLSAMTPCNVVPYTGCYTRIINGGHTERGCISNLEDDDFLQCLSNRTNCVSCVGKGCNNEVVPKNRLECYHCNSNDDPECEATALNRQVCSIYGLEETCVIALNDDVTYRGCSSEISCESTSRRKCRICNSSGCNSANLNEGEEYDPNHGMWQDLPLKCHNCTGNDCLSSLGPAQLCVNNNEQDCITVFDTNGDVIRRGCVDEVNEEDEIFDHCFDNPELCFTCKSNECNIAWNTTEYITCRYCDSKSDPNCINSGNSNNNTRLCREACMIALYPSHSGHGGANELIRTCLDDKETVTQHTCAENVSCSSCTSNNCNNYTFPNDRLECYFCNGTTCENTTSQNCPTYKENDECYAIYNGTEVIQLGCSSSLQEDLITELIKSNKYFSCKEKNCNTLSNLPETKSCVVCNSKANANCASYPELLTSKASCLLPISQCYTNVASDGSTNRGCAISLETTDLLSCLNGNSTCTTCYGETCNNEVFPTDRRRCHICSSQTDKTCTSNPQANSVCPTFDENNTCVTKFTNGVTERGCSTDLNCDISNNKLCRICELNGCNTIDLLKENGAGTTAANFLLVLILAIVSVFSMSS